MLCTYISQWLLCLLPGKITLKFLDFSFPSHSLIHPSRGNVDRSERDANAVKNKGRKMYSKSKLTAGRCNSHGSISSSFFRYIYLRWCFTRTVFFKHDWRIRTKKGWLSHKSSNHHFKTSSKKIKVQKNWKPQCTFNCLFSHRFST